MIVECEECQAKFKLDDAKVPEKGIKVRCSKCKHVFVVQKPAPPVEELVPPQEPEEALGVSESPEPPVEEPPMDEGIKEDEFQIDDSEAESFVADRGTTGTGEPESEPVASEEAFESTIKIDLSDQQEMPFEDEEAFPEGVAKEIPMKRAMGTPILIALVALVVIALAAVAYLFVLPNFMGPPETPTSNLNTTDLDGYFEENVQIPKVFVIKGNLINESKKARRFIQVKGILYNKQGKPVKVQLAYCGNLIPKRDLKTKAPKTIQKAMMNKSGARGANNLVKPGASIPFMVVFFYLPKEMAEYSAEVVTSEIIK
jgi:predicted Zn finger-like uncharacterized protein